MGVRKREVDRDGGVGPDRARSLPVQPAQRADGERLAPEQPRYERGNAIPFVDPARLVLLPDWERVYHLVRDEPPVRRNWAWMMLPIRFGYPATVRDPGPALQAAIRYAHSRGITLVAAALPGRGDVPAALAR